MADDLTTTADTLLRRAVDGGPRIPGVVAIATDRHGAIFQGAAGVRALGQDAAMTVDTVLAMFSTTKAVAATAVLQLVEDGRLDLDAPAKRYAPAIGAAQVLDGFDAAGQPLLRAPRRDITTRMLLLHTAGFAYDSFNADYARLVREHGQVPTGTGRRVSLDVPLLFDPGERWEYGCSIDWAGQVVEAITGRRLGEVMQTRIFDPLGMTSTAFALNEAMRARLARVHQRRADGSLTPLLSFELPPDPEVHMGGHGLYSTAEDYCRFIRMWLNDGMGPGGPVLTPETVRAAEKNGLGALKIRGLPAVAPARTNDAEFFPGMAKSWAMSFMVNDADAPTGRPAGSLAWAGLANLYYWIDRRNGVGGFWAAQVFPFADAACMAAYLDFETAVYDSRGRSAAA